MIPPTSLRDLIETLSNLLLPKLLNSEKKNPLNNWMISLKKNSKQLINGNPLLIIKKNHTMEENSSKNGTKKIITKKTNPVSKKGTLQAIT